MLFQKGQKSSYREHKAIFEVWELFVAFLTAVHAILLVHHLLVAVFTGTGLIQAVLFSDVDNGGDAREIISLGKEDSGHQFKINK